MSNLFADKVDMSLDDIIKLEKFGKRKHSNIARRQGRGNRAPATDGLPRGGRGVRNRGRGARGSRGIRQTINPIKQFHTNLQRGIRGQRRGRGRGINRQQPNISPLNHNNIDQQNIRGRGRGRRRGRGGRVTGLVFTKSRDTQQTGQQLVFDQQQIVQQRQRLNKVRQQAALLREKKLAIQNLQRAQKNVQTINMAIQKTSRDNRVNQLRGLSNIHTGPFGDRGRRKLLSSLKRQGSNNLSNDAPTRQLSNTSVTISNLSALSTVSSSSGRKMRRWRKNNKTQVASDHFTIQVANQNLQPVRKQSPILNELKLLKPAVTTTYKFEKSVFAAPTTTLSLNDRFSGTSFADEVHGTLEDRKVFI